MIQRKEFNEGTFEKRKRGEERPVTKFMRTNRNNAYKVTEIYKITKINKNTIRDALAMLKKAGKVKHKIPYFMWAK